MNAQTLTAYRNAILRALLPNTAVATYPATIARTIRRDGCPAATETEVTEHLHILAGLGQVEQVAADGADGEISAADKGWKLTAKGIKTAEQATY